MSLKSAKVARRAEAIETLREIFPAGSTVSTSLGHVSRSGMLRSISVLVGQPDGGVRDVSHLVALAVGNTLHSDGGVKMGGCGMDMGFALVYSLARVLHDEFRCTGHDGSKRAPRCPSNDHSNAYGMLRREALDGLEDGEAVREYIREQMPRTWKRGAKHSDGGYALSHHWV